MDPRQQMTSLLFPLLFRARPYRNEPPNGRIVDQRQDNLTVLVLLLHTLDLALLPEKAIPADLDQRIRRVVRRERKRQRHLDYGLNEQGLGIPALSLSPQVNQFYGRIVNKIDSCFSIDTAMQAMILTDEKESFVVDYVEARDLELKLNVTSKGRPWIELGNRLFKFSARDPSVASRHVITGEQLAFLKVLQTRKGTDACKDL